MNEKEHNFISVVIYVTHDDAPTISFFRALRDAMEKHFSQYEFVVINANCAVNKLDKLREWAQCLPSPLTIVNMSMEQSKEACMNAGIDFAIGDYVFEFDHILPAESCALIGEAYKLSQKGNDIVSVCPGRQKLLSTAFYKVFNTCSRSAYPIRTTLFRLVSRRAINRVHATNEYMDYRKAAYAFSGLKSVCLETNLPLPNHTDEEGTALAVKSLILYTEAGYTLSITITCFALMVTMGIFLYTLAVYLTGQPVAGWTTLMLVLAFGFSGLFIVASIIIKYLALLLESSCKKQRYLIENIEKIQG